MHAEQGTILALEEAITTRNINNQGDVNGPRRERDRIIDWTEALIGLRGKDANRNHRNQIPRIIDWTTDITPYSSFKRHPKKRQKTEPQFHSS
jgi:hypothetical protein